MVKYVKGDALKAPQSLIVHQCNAQGVMGSGIARSIRDQFPDVYQRYLAWHEDVPKSKMMGMIQIVKIDNNRSICNLIGQYHYLPRGQKHTSYDALEEGFQSIKKLHKGDIAMPKIGCGLGGGDWNVVEAIIKSVFNDRDVYVYEI